MANKWSYYKKGIESLNSIQFFKAKEKKMDVKMKELIPHASSQFPPSGIPYNLYYRDTLWSNTTKSGKEIYPQRILWTKLKQSFYHVFADSFCFSLLCGSDFGVHIETCVAPAQDLLHEFQVGRYPPGSALPLKQFSNLIRSAFYIF